MPEGKDLPVKRKFTRTIISIIRCTNQDASMALVPCVMPEEKDLPAQRNVNKDIKTTVEQVVKEMSRATQPRGVAYPGEHCSKRYKKKRL
jgi:hypothetical protein